MEIEEKRNPNSWSELPLDLSSSIFKRLGFADFRQAKSVCSSWHSASKQSVPKKNQIHWLILFPKDNNSSTLLFNPEEKDNKLYRTRDLGFQESVCIATYGSWLLMENTLGNLYIVNLFNQHERMINLPPREKGIIRSIVFWIDEKTKDYVVIYGRFGRLVKLDVVYCSSKKKGDDDYDDDDDDNLLWKQIPETSNCIHLVYKDHMLYLLSLPGIFKIFDFRENIPKETFQCGVYVDRLRLGIPRPTHLVVSVTKGGEVVVFKVEKFFRPRSKTWSSFRVLKIYSSGFLKKQEVVDSLGDEAMLFDQGITVLPSEDNEGFVRNSIYFSDCCENNKNHNLFRFNLETKTMEPLHEFDSSSLQFSRPRWFLPSFTHT